MEIIKNKIMIKITLNASFISGIHLNLVIVGLGDAFQL